MTEDEKLQIAELITELQICNIDIQMLIIEFIREDSYEHFKLDAIKNRLRNAEIKLSAIANA